MYLITVLSALKTHNNSPCSVILNNKGVIKGWALADSLGRPSITEQQKLVDQVESCQIRQSQMLAIYINSQV